MNAYARLIVTANKVRPARMSDPEGSSSSLTVSSNPRVVSYINLGLPPGAGGLGLELQSSSLNLNSEAT